MNSSKLIDSSYPPNHDPHHDPALHHHRTHDPHRHIALHHHATIESKDNKIKSLQESSSSSTLLMRAVVEDDISILVRLLSSNDYTSTLFVRDKKGRTALDWARMCRNYQVLK